ncbi:MAG: aminotransferase class I/II-fold pyridoxal phosphate-dependent enzyme [Alphaproteobacteria bacterium]|nr:aminotransferase class I/II-fold pyridoxal phosphate-dependent enzyme [Alphaproteobacteria bacterium]MBU0799099.1 aminotransferase class I/II-fold pyridoxal phosphate-dependent enzyme [Alphaproteobacteria bacterium]MBU0888704.1 aminotransferase class I/II-fold pyridoxal phosphate-dependent enzyme [Alphaproteobacteria bacterium]MBU1813562.1 aminotransferase class I/II-fold pyridoxal phosphate-dependent enzyme [Alphaproteobacteria bacterium]MBU2091506.1 aminotransferase class I/II-fold pyridox
MFNDRLDPLADYPFRKLSTLLDPIQPVSNDAPLMLSVGEPQNQPPAFIKDVLSENAHLWNKYPPSLATPAYRQAVADWLTMRYKLPAGFVDPDRNIVPVPGTREPLFMLALVAIPAAKGGGKPVVLMPSPSYHVYRGAAMAANAESVYLPATAESNFLPDPATVSKEVLDRTALCYLCTPSNPQGTMGDLAYLKSWIKLAREHDFVLAVDECYAEIYDVVPPSGALEACAALGDGPYGTPMDNVVVFHSLSKRSSAPGLRAGFMAGDARVMARYAELIGYACTPMPLPIVAAATAVWRDEEHVVANQKMYRGNFDIASRLLTGKAGYFRPQAGFFLWLDVGDGEATCARLWKEAAIRTIPGAYMAVPDAQGVNPGAPYVRVALVYDNDVMEDALARLARAL